SMLVMRLALGGATESEMAEALLVWAVTAAVGFSGSMRFANSAASAVPANKAKLVTNAEKRRMTAYPLSGVRPSPGAATSEAMIARKFSRLAELLKLAAPEDGRTPESRYMAPGCPVLRHVLCRFGIRFNWP